MTAYDNQEITLTELYRWERLAQFPVTRTDVPAWVEAADRLSQAAYKAPDKAMTAKLLHISSELRSRVAETAHTMPPPPPSELVIPDDAPANASCLTQYPTPAGIEPWDPDVLANEQAKAAQLAKENAARRARVEREKELAISNDKSTRRLHKRDPNAPPPGGWRERPNSRTGGSNA